MSGLANRRPSNRPLGKGGGEAIIGGGMTWYGMVRYDMEWDGMGT